MNYIYKVYVCRDGETLPEIFKMAEYLNSQGLSKRYAKGYILYRLREMYIL